MSFVTPTFFLNNDIIILSIPTINTAYFDLSVTFVLLNTGDVFLGSNQTKSIWLLGSNQNPIAGGTEINIKSGIIVTSLLNSGTRSLNLQFLRDNSSYANGTFSLSIKTNSLISASFGVGIGIVSSTTTYSFSITIKNKLGIEAIIKVTLPTDITIKNNVTKCLSLTVSLSSASALNTQPICTIINSNYFTITNITTAILPANSQINFTVGGITNPLSVKPSGSILI
jgi:hypothetical protein